MSERVAIVAGAGGELGRATAEKLTAAGFTVAGIDRNKTRSEGAAGRHRARGRTPSTRPRPAAPIDRIAAEARPACGADEHDRHLSAWRRADRSRRTTYGS